MTRTLRLRGVLTGLIGPWACALIACSGDIGPGEGASATGGPPVGGLAGAGQDGSAGMGSSAPGTVGVGSGSGGAPSGGVSGGASAVSQGEVGGASAVGAEAGALGPRPSLAARLSKTEYASSILDVLGVTVSAEELNAANGGIPDDAGDGVFKHVADKQITIEQHALAYFEVAEAVVARIDVAALGTRFDFCSEGTSACGTAMITAVGERLYRRPLTEREIDAMVPVFTAALDEALPFDAAVRWTLEAMLQAPQFLFRMEDETSGVAGQARDLTGQEIAARLASFLWLSVPDDELRAAAAQGSLNTPAALLAQVTRMLADPRAQRFTQAFIEDFSRARLASFEGATDEDRAALNESVIATFQDHLWTQGGSISGLFTTTRFLVNAKVAEILGVPHSGAGVEVADISGVPERMGLMTHPGVISGMGDRSTGSFVNRGKYLMERLLCRNPITFPPELTTELQTFNADTTGFNEHERVAVRKTRPECWGCHTQFEPFAFGFSRFDGEGRYVGDVDAAGKPLPLDGWVPTSGEADSPHYANVAEYMQILASEPIVQTCMTEHFIAFATARTTDAAAKAEAETVGAEYRAAGNTLPAMVNAVVGSGLFRGLLVVPATTAAAGGN